MESTLIAAVSASIGFVGKSLLDSFFKRREKNYEISKKYSRPILFSGAELQDRLWYITQREASFENPVLLRKDDSEPFSAISSMKRRHYLVSTIYLFGRYFAYIEILKKKVQFVELHTLNKTINFTLLVKNVERILSDTNLSDRSKIPIKTDRQLFKLQQTYIGEKLIIEKDGEMQCMSFADFYDGFDNTFSKIQDFQDLIELITKAVSGDREDFSLARCCLLANALVDLIDYLDPKYQYVPLKDREKIRVPCIDNDL